VARTPHHHLASVGSTLTQAWKMVCSGEAWPFWLTADEQTQGRGRLQRDWVSEAGNLYATHIGQAPQGMALALLPFAVSLAVLDAVEAALPAETHDLMGLKWPNDVMLDCAKLSGILIEQRSTPATGALVAIGIGINIAHAPELPDRLTTCLATHGSLAGPGEVFLLLAAALDTRLGQLASEPQQLHAQWMARATGLGGPVRVALGQETLTGTFDHLAEDGAMMLRLPSGALRAIRSGDVFTS
jgi:BirA family transcriptional regulator, biotin operon repressor / biotin---[acetyl-CoA-carboxylase] ligase